MKASEIIKELPEQNTKEREEKLINFIGLGNYIPPNLVCIESVLNGHVAKIKVMSDAFMVGEPDDCVRINATMAGEQKIADMLQMSLITPKIADLIYFNATIQIEPQTQDADYKMSYTSRMVTHSKSVTDAILFIKQPTPSDLIADVGKDWVLSNKLINNDTLAANYGWHTKKKPDPNKLNGPFKCQAGGYMWQTLGTRHNTSHVDYSQTIRLMDREIIVDGNRMYFEEIASNPELCGLVSYECPLLVTRHPKE